MKSSWGAKGRISLVGAAALLGILSCGGDETDKPSTSVGPIVVADIVKIQHGSQIKFPLDAYQRSDSDQATFTYARGLLIKSCMGAKGFSYDVPSYDELKVPPAFERHARLFGNVEIGVARTYGLRPPSDPSQARRDLTDEAVTNSAYGAALWGASDPTPPQGCFGESVKILKDTRVSDTGEMDDTPANLPLQLESAAYESARNHDQVKSALESWVSCMKSRGYEYVDPLAPNDDKTFARSNEHGKPSASEIAVAVADVECKDESQIASIWYAVSVKYQELLIEEHHAELEALKKAEGAVLEAATKVLADNGVQK